MSLDSMQIDDWYDTWGDLARPLLAAMEEAQHIVDADIDLRRQLREEADATPRLPVSVHCRYPYDRPQVETRYDPMAAGEGYRMRVRVELGYLLTLPELGGREWDEIRAALGVQKVLARRPAS